MCVCDVCCVRERMRENKNIKKNNINEYVREMNMKKVIDYFADILIFNSINN